MPLDLKLEQAKYLQQVYDVKALPKVAQDALEAGYDSRSLRMLAGMEKPTVWDAEPLWFRAVEELGIDRVSVEESLLLVADALIDDVEVGRASASVTASVLARLCIQNDYDRRLLDIYSLVDLLAIGHANEDHLREAFRRFKVRDFRDLGAINLHQEQPNFIRRVWRVVSRR